MQAFFKKVILLTLSPSVHHSYEDTKWHFTHALQPAI